jgi:hypothetical protein
MSLSEKEWNLIAKVLGEIEKIEEDSNKILKRKKSKSVSKKKKKSSKSKCSGGL